MENYKVPQGEDYIMFYKESKYDESYQTLPPSIYQLANIGSAFSFIPAFVKVGQIDNLVKFESGLVNEVVNKATSFFDTKTEDVYRELKIAHKMGILFYGKPGTGKTCTCTLIMKSIIDKHKAICINATGQRIYVIKEVIKDIRKIQNNPIVVFVDEFENSLKHEEESYLTFLDGADSVDGLIFIACTNYINKISDRIKNRKSRIKYMYSIDSLPLSVYREYIDDRLPKYDASIRAQFAYLAEEKALTIDQLKHALIDYRLEKVTIERAIQEASKVYERIEDKKEDE